MSKIKKLFGFEGYVFNDTEHKLSYPFRLKKVSENAPLALILCGTDTVGNDNIRQLFSAHKVYKRLKGYNILIPQIPREINKNSSWEEYENKCDLYSASLNDLTKQYSNKPFIVGISMGSFLGWRCVYSAPELYSCALLIAGGYKGENNPCNHEFSRYKKTPLWAVHSVCDRNVSCEMDDYAAEQLNIKYTRYNNFGHSFTTIFFLRNEEWQKWIKESTR